MIIGCSTLLKAGGGPDKATARQFSGGGGLF